MPPKAKAKGAKKGKKEVLPVPSSLPDGQRNFYIGGWSSYGTIDDITKISLDLVERFTKEDREVDPLPRTNILILPSDDTDCRHPKEATSPAPHVPDELTELVMADKMQIEGVSHLTVRRSQANRKEWIRPPKPGEEPPAEAVAAPAAAAPEGGEAAPEEEGAAAAQSEEAQSDEKKVDLPPEEDQQLKEEERLAGISVPLGSDFTARDAVLNGVIRLIGVLPQIVVKPVLPEPPVREDPNAKGKGKKGKAGRRASSVGGDDAAAGKKGSKGKKGKKAKKLTPEELEELERKMAEEDALFLKQTEEALALAKEQEEHLMTFAHPDRWSHVVFSNVTFTGPVQVVRAHTKFMNCCFASPYPDRPQLMVHQYCNVECVKCTFDAPARSGLYALPASQVKVTKCLFSGIPQRQLLLLESPAEEVTAKPVEKEAVGEDEDAEDDEPKKASGQYGSTSESEMPRNPEVTRAIEEVQKERPASVGLFTDCSKVHVEKCRFIVLGTGALFHGKYKVDATVPRIRTAAKTHALVSIISCFFQHAFSTGICVDKSADDILIHRNVVSDCQYYGLDLRKGSADIGVYQNKFLIGAAVRIREGVHAQLLHNDVHSIPIDDNKRDNPCLECRY